jgi:cobalamin biosynthesis protein CobT
MISILHNKSTCPGTLTDHVHKLISLISSKNVRVVPGPSACVDANHTVYLPPLPDGATEKDFIKYFHLGTHEQSHIEGGSDFNRASKDRIKFRLENALEDIRCEQLQEKSLPGLVPYRIKYYAGALEDFANQEMSEASFNDMVKLIGTLGKYIIIHIRKIQLQADHLDIKASRALLYAYENYVSDLENRILSMTTTDQMFELAEIIYNRFKKIIRDQLEDNHSSNNSQGNTKPQQGDNDDSGEETEDQETSGENSETDTESSSDSDDSDDDGEQASGESSEEDSDPEDSGNAGGAGTPSGDSSPEDDGSDGEPSDLDNEEIEEELQRIIDELNSNNDAMDVVTDLKDQINSQGTRDLPYMVNPNVQDVIGVGPETTPEIAAKIREIGLGYLGPKGSQITKLFVSQSNTRTAYNQYSGNMDVISVVSDIHDTRDDVYRKVSAPRLDKAAITFLMDNSGSMKHLIGHMYAILSGLMQYLSRANIPTEAIGYTAESSRSDIWRDRPAYLTLIKQFHEQYNGAAMRRCIPPASMGQTNDLDGLKFAVPRIWARPERKKIIMILCDGDPDIGSYTLNAKLIRSYKEYIDICRKAGIIIFGIGINRNLSEYFGEDNYASVDLSNVGQILIDRLTKILNKA